VTHVITTRPIPSERSENQPAEQQEPEPQPEPEPEEQPQTINPSLLDRTTAARRKLLFEFRNVPSRSQLSHDPTKPNRGARNNDVLRKAMEMGKKIWSLDKFSTMVSVLLESEMQENAQISRTTSTRGPHGTAKPQESNLLQLLHNERVNGPSDRDLATSNKELIYFKGPFVYIYDMDEKSKPIMVREYNKVTSKADGDWPQFRSVGNGRCPFVEEVEYTTKEERKPQDQDQQAPKAIGKRQEGTTMLKAPTAPPPMPVTGKRTLTEMEDGHNKGGKLRAVFNPARAALSKQAFLSRAPSGRVHQGEPVASGLQASNVTSAIRSQMISSTSGLTGVKAGTSKEIHGLQRQVLQKAAPGSHGTSSRLAEQSVEGTSSRSMSISRQTSKVGQRQPTSSQRLEVAAPAQPLKSKKDLKPGYCENCQDKFRDFDEVRILLLLEAM
jgi:regulatory subunit for Cdc7p protein kinase